MTGIGGDCFSLVSRPGKPVWGYNGSGRAGMNASDQVLRAKGLAEIGDSIHAVTVPGAIEAWEEILKAHGRFGLDRALAPRSNMPRADFRSPRAWPGTGSDTLPSSRAMPEHRGIIFSTAGLPRKADVIRFPALASTLKAIATKGARAFYEGEIADDMAANTCGARLLSHG